MAEHVHQLALPVGHQLRHYRLDKVLGAGGFGITYLAQDPQSNQLVAIKELLPTCMVTRKGTKVVTHTSLEYREWEMAQKRFREEAESLLLCDHPKVLKVFCTFRENGTVYMVTKYEEGCVMEKWLQQIYREGRGITENNLRAMLLPTLSALEKVHQAGLVHRDVKPENIYLTSRGPVLLDFGSARQLVFSKTMPVTTMLTHGYAPMEQYGNVLRQGPWTDVYSLGAVMYRSIANAIPPMATNRYMPGAADSCLCLKEAYRGRYSAELLESIDAALVVDPQSRLRSATEWKNKLGQSGASSPPYQPESKPQTIRPILEPGPREQLLKPRSSVEPTPLRPPPVIEPAPNLDLHGTVLIDSVLARKGGRVDVEVEGRRLLVDVPPNTSAGQIIHLLGKGRAGATGKRPGDAFVRVQVRPAPPPPQPLPVVSTSRKKSYDKRRGNKPAKVPRFRETKSLKEANPLALLSVFCPGLGSLPKAALLPAILFLLTIVGAYLLAAAYWDKEQRLQAELIFACAVFLHASSVIVAFCQKTSQEPFEVLPKTGLEWVVVASSLALLVLEFFSWGKIESNLIY